MLVYQLSWHLQTHHQMKANIQSKPPTTAYPTKATSPNNWSQQGAFIFDASITIMEDEQTAMAKNDSNYVCRVIIDSAHSPIIKPALTMLQRWHNERYALIVTFQRAIHHITHEN